MLEHLRRRWTEVYHVVAGVVAGLVGRVDERELREAARRGPLIEDVLPLERGGKFRGC